MRSAKPLLALKIDVDTLRGTRLGVPRLASFLERKGAQATFFFSVGPDRTGRAVRRVFRRGFLRKVARTSVLEHYGLATLLYGTLLPAPSIERACARELRAVRACGFETGLHAYDHVTWQDCVAKRDAAWTAREMRRGIDAFVRIFDEAPRAHAAAGWQMNDSAFESEAELGFDYGSDTRGTHPFVPVLSSGQRGPPQLPTTLPTLDELIGIAGATPDDAAERILELTQEPGESRHVFTLHAELEGIRLMNVFERLVAGWLGQGYALVAMRSLFEQVMRLDMPVHRIRRATIEGRSGTMTMQGAPV